MAGFEAKLPELAEADARGEIAVIYGELRAFARVPFVALIYRHLATREGVLPWAWTALRPAFASGAIPDAAARLAEAALLPPVAPIRAAEWRMAGLNAADRPPVEAVLAGYDRANPINLVAARLIIGLLRREAPPVAPTVPGEGRPRRPVRPAIPPLPPLLPAAAIPPEVSVRLASLAGFDQPAAGAVTPSLYRHLAHWPGLLALLPDRLEPAFRLGAVRDAAAAYRRAADAEIATLLPAARQALDERGGAQPPAEAAGLAETLDAFAALIPEMIAVGRLIRAALPSERLL
ncbi:MAG: hypothetical protein AB7P52_17975 [Alphaproteobacteria bacterium]